MRGETHSLRAKDEAARHSERAQGSVGREVPIKLHSGDTDTDSTESASEQASETESPDESETEEKSAKASKAEAEKTAGEPPEEGTEGESEEPISESPPPEKAITASPTPSAAHAAKTVSPDSDKTKRVSLKSVTPPSETVPLVTPKDSGPTEHPQLGRNAINERLSALGAPFTLGEGSFPLKFKQELTIEPLSGERGQQGGGAFLLRAVSEEPTFLTDKTLLLTIDIDVVFIEPDIEVIQLLVRPEACASQAQGACSTLWHIRELGVASPPHRIVTLAFSSPTGAQFTFNEPLLEIQRKPFDLDLRRLSLKRFFQDHRDFFADKNGNFASAPLWNAFAVTATEPGEAVSLGPPLVELPPGITAKEKQEALRRAAAAGEEVEGLTTPQHGGASPGAERPPTSTSTILKYVLGSFLVIALLVGVAITTCRCGSR